MRIANCDGRLVLVDGNRLLDVQTAGGGRFGADPQSVYESWDDFRDWAAGRPAGEWMLLDPARLGPPAPRPRQVFAVALNYRDHAEEAGLEVPAHPSIFTKFPSCIAGPNDGIRLSTTVPTGRWSWWPSSEHAPIEWRKVRPGSTSRG